MTLLDYVLKIRPVYLKTMKEVPVVQSKDFSILNEYVNDFKKNFSKYFLSNRCHVLSMKFAMENEEIGYAEGYSSTRWLNTKIILPVQHAWNKWGDYYFDLTSEEIYKHTFDNYVVLAEGKVEEIKQGKSHPFMKDESFFGYHLLNKLDLF